MTRKLLIAVPLLVIALLIAAILALPAFVAAQNHRANIEALASSLTGRTVHIAGTLHLTLIPTPRLTATHITITGPNAETITARALTLGLSLPALLHGQLVADNLTFDRPDITYPWPRDVVGLHNFTDGYCGISQIEDGKCCLCYLTTAANLQKNGNDIKKLEHNILMQNPWLRQIFSEAIFLYDTPAAISQISFQKKEQVQEHVLLLGDAAGMITPLCGNGMSMAFHSAKIAGALIDDFLQGSITRSAMEKSYISAWQHNFSSRTTFGRIVQRNFGKDNTTAFFIKAMNALPFVRKAIIRGTSGRPF